MIYVQEKGPQNMLQNTKNMPQTPKIGLKLSKSLFLGINLVRKFKSKGIFTFIKFKTFVDFKYIYFLLKYDA